MQLLDALPVEIVSHIGLYLEACDFLSLWSTGNVGVQRLLAQPHIVSRLTIIRSSCPLELRNLATITRKFPFITQCVLHAVMPISDELVTWFPVHLKKLSFGGAQPGLIDPNIRHGDRVRLSRSHLLSDQHAKLLPPNWLLFIFLNGLGH